MNYLLYLIDCHDWKGGNIAWCAARQSHRRHVLPSRIREPFIPSKDTGQSVYYIVKSLGEIFLGYFSLYI